MDKQGQRFLLTLNSPIDDTDEYSVKFIFEGFLAAILGILCLVYVVLMCTCKDSKLKEDAKDIELQKISEQKSLVKVTENGGKTKVIAETTASHSQPINLASTLVRSTNARELPAPPFSNSSKQAQNKVMSCATGKANEDADHVNRQQPKSSNKVKGGKDQSENESQYYDHLGFKSQIKPSDYDCWAELNAQGAHALKSEVEDDDYSEVEEKIYPTLIEVGIQKTELLQPLPKGKEENPYNHIGDSDGTVSVSFIHNLKHTHDQDDPYTVVQDDSAGDLKSIMKARDKVLNVNTSELKHFPNTQTKSQDKGECLEDYAVVNKIKGTVTNIEVNDEEEIAAYSISPPEPPRLYNISDSYGNMSVPATPNKQNRNHKYSKVTARESLASMLARKAVNLQEAVPESSENTYDMVEGCSGTEIGGASCETEDNQSGDVYDEIGISEGATSPYIKSSSKTNIGAAVSTSADSHNLMTKSQVPSTEDQMDNYYSNLEYHDVVSKSLNHLKDILEYEDSAGSYVMLKNDSYIPAAAVDKLKEVTLVPNNQTVVRERYSDYESVADIPVVAVSYSNDTTMDSLVNKKVGQRRQKLDPSKDNVV